MKQLKKLAFALAAVAATAGAWAASEYANGYEWVYQDMGGYALIGNGYGCVASPEPKGAVTIPSTLGGLPVQVLGADSLADCTGITSVTIPEGLLTIGNRALSGCTALKKVTIPDSVKIVGEEAFINCNASLYDTTTIPGVSLVDGWAVDYASSLSGVLNLKGARGIANGLFDGNEKITSVKIPSTMTEIGYNAFQLSYVKSVTIPSSVKKIYRDAFSYSRLTTVYVDKGDTERVRQMLLDSDFGNSKVDSLMFVEAGAACKLTVKSANTSYGTVSGSGTYAPGAMVTIKAKAKSGYVFAGWYTDKACKTKLNPPGYDNRKPTVKIEMPPQKTAVYARFVTKAADKSKLSLTSATKKLATTAAKATAGKNFELKLGIYSYSLMTVTAKSLPKGLSIDKTTGTISGTPTKPGSYTATVTVATAAGNKLTFKVKVKVSNYTWSKGTFNGYAFPDGVDKLGGYLTFTVGSTGKISGKVTYKGKAYPFTSQYSSCSSSKAKFKLPAMKLGSKSVAAVYLTVTPKQARIEGESVVEATDAGAIYVAQKAFESVGGMYGKSYSFDSADTGSGLKNGDSIKVTWKHNAVKISGKVNGKSLAVGSVPLFLSSKEVVDWDSSYKFSVYICDSASGYSAWLFFFVETDSLGDLVSDKAILQK